MSSTFEQIKAATAFIHRFGMRVNRLLAEADVLRPSAVLRHPFSKAGQSLNFVPRQPFA